MVKVKYAYCAFCKKEIEEPTKKPLKPMQKTLWVIGSLATLGIGAIVFAIYHNSKRSIYCPVCISPLTFSKEPFDEPSKEIEPKTPKEKIYKKAGKEVPDKKEKKPKIIKEKEEKTEQEELKDKEDQLFCPYCGNKIKKNIKTCPHCKTALDERIQE